MLTNKQIESQDYTINEVADLKMRLEIAMDSLSAIQGAIEHDQPHKAYEWSVNDLARITGGHNPDCNGDISLDSDDRYRCNCHLIATT